MQDRAAEYGRRVRGGIRLHVISRDTTDEAWAAADRLIAGLDGETIAQHQSQLRSVGSEGQRRNLELHGGDRNRLLVGPNLWAGSASSVAGRAGTALVGSHDEVAERIRECRDIRNRSSSSPKSTPRVCRTLRTRGPTQVRVRIGVIPTVAAGGAGTTYSPINDRPQAEGRMLCICSN